MEALASKTYPVFVEKLSEYDVLLIDLFEDIGGKGSTTEEFLHLFKTMLQKGVSIAVSICIRANRPTDTELYHKVSNSLLCEHQHTVCMGTENKKLEM